MYAYVVCNKDIDYENLESLKDNMFNKNWCPPYGTLYGNYTSVVKKIPHGKFECQPICQPC